MIYIYYINPISPAFNLIRFKNKNLWTSPNFHPSLHFPQNLFFFGGLPIFQTCFFFALREQNPSKKTSNPKHRNTQTGLAFLKEVLQGGRAPCLSLAIPGNDGNVGPRSLGPQEISFVGVVFGGKPWWRKTPSSCSSSMEHFAK